MSNLLTDQEGRDVVVTAQRYLIQRRLSRFFKRTFVIAFDDYENTGYFDLSILLGQLNEAHDPELRALFRLLALTGALPTTFETLEVYVDGTTGNDISGDGSATHPFKTLWFVDYLPKTILHPVRIVIADNCNAGGQLSLNFDFAKDASIIQSSYLSSSLSSDIFFHSSQSLSLNQTIPKVIFFIIVSHSLYKNKFVLFCAL